MDTTSVGIVKNKERNVSQSVESGCANHSSKSPKRIIHDRSRGASLASRARTHDTAREALIHANLPVHLDDALHQNRRHLLVRQRVLQSVPKDEAQREALTRLVGTCERRAKTRDDARAFDRSVNTPSFSHPTRPSRERDIARSPRSSSSLDAMKTLCARRIAPGDGFGAKTPPSLSSIQCLGALRRFKCFLSPLAMFLVRRQSFASRKGGARRRAAIDARARGRRVDGECLRHIIALKVF